jgi:hypothetical protein
MIFNYCCAPMTALARGLVRPFGNAENRCFGGASAVRLVYGPSQYMHRQHLGSW